MKHLQNLTAPCMCKDRSEQMHQIMRWLPGRLMTFEGGTLRCDATEVIEDIEIPPEENERMHSVDDMGVRCCNKGN